MLSGKTRASITYHAPRQKEVTAAATSRCTGRCCTGHDSQRPAVVVRVNSQSTRASETFKWLIECGPAASSSAPGRVALASELSRGSSARWPVVLPTFTVVELLCIPRALQPPPGHSKRALWNADRRLRHERRPGDRTVLTTDVYVRVPRMIPCRLANIGKLWANTTPARR